jgi:hypothetical protein
MKIESIIKKHLRSVLNEGTDDGTYMVLQNLVQMRNDIEAILKCKHHPDFGKLVTGEHAWAGDHITTSKDDIEEVSNFITSRCQSEDMNESKKEEELNEKCWDGYKAVGSKMKNGKRVPNCVPTNESTEEIDESKNKPTNPKLWAQCLAWARSKYDVCPSAYCNGAAAKRYKSKGGGWRKVK